MEESTNHDIILNTNSINAFDNGNVLSEFKTADISSKCDSSDDEVPTQRFKRRLQNFSDSESEKENLHIPSADDNGAVPNMSGNESDISDSPGLLKIISSKSRIPMKESSSDTDSEAPTNVPTLKNEEQQMRLNNRTKKLKQKFEGLLNSRSKQAEPQNLNNKQSSEDVNNDESDEATDNEITSIARIKQKIKKSMAASSIYDPDTSDEENNMNNKSGLKQAKKKVQKSTKIIDAKPIRMSAKQAMENMQLIKSESNRMLREKEISLPYHRPKALSLKDIMSRRKPAVSSDGKALPIKMNEEQLKQYAKQLELRQKEMMELCKSDSDDDTNENEKTEGPALSDSEPKELETNVSIVEPNAAEKEATEQYNNINTDKTINCPDIDDCISKEIDMHDSASNNEDSSNQQSDTNQNDCNGNIGLHSCDNSVEEENVVFDNTENISKKDEMVNKDCELSEQNANEPQKEISIGDSERESQLISLHYTENDTETFKEPDILNNNMEELAQTKDISNQTDNAENDMQDDFFSDDDVNMEDIDKIIQSAELMKDIDGNNGCSMLIKDPLTLKPKLTGAPGMVIDLDDADAKPKRSGVELLKERFTYFSKHKTPEELERENEKRLKPGALHLKLKQELEEQIAEQRSLEWAKRLEEEKQLHQEMDAILDDKEESDDDMEKTEAKIDEEDNEESASENETDDLIENDIVITDKPLKHNPMLDDEAEESDVEGDNAETGKEEAEMDQDIEESDNSDESSEDESSDSEEEEENRSNHKKGRILKAFEDSDDEDETKNLVEAESVAKNTSNLNKPESPQRNCDNTDIAEVMANSSDIQSSSQDDVIQLAQRHQSASEDLFTTQESSTPNNTENGTISETCGDQLGTQTFSISSARPEIFLCPSQPYYDAVISEVTDNFSQNILGSQLRTTQTSQSQPIGEDILALCTGKFYDNEFVLSSDEKPIESTSQEKHIGNNFIVQSQESSTSIDNIRTPGENKLSLSANNKEENISKILEDSTKKTDKDHSLLKSLIDELEDPKFDQPKQNKFFTGASQNRNEVPESNLMKKRLVIVSDDETTEANTVDNALKKKKLKKKKLEKRALQISDDEDEEDGLGLEDEDGVSDVEDGERFVDYDSEENEIEVKPDKPKKKRKANDFFEQEAELTSEDEWIGSGDEDEHGLDRMEREEGDDEVFHQGKLRKELGQIHMRDVLDQDKREVRLLQELLFEDGDLGGGHRQRKFRWRNAGDEEAGTVPDDFTDTQEEEFESEEQWRKQRHEREVFLRQMQNQVEEEGSPNVTVNRTTIIKANLLSKSMSTLLMEANQSKTDISDSAVVTEKKPVKDIPSPKKSFSILQQNYHSSVLNRGRGALARLAALATPLAAADDDAPKITSLASRKRNFVFTALTPDEDPPKVTIKRKADLNAGTPKLVKKIRLEEKQAHRKISLLDHINT